MISNTLKVGMLGLGNYSTLHYIDLLNRRFQQKNDEYSTFPFLLYNTDFQNLNPFLPNQFDELIPKVRHYIESIKALNINYLIVPNITLHETLDQLDLEIEIAHPLHLAIAKIKESKSQKACVFGTQYTMNSSYIKSTFKDNGIEIISPSNEDQLAIDAFRVKQYLGTSTPAEIQHFNILKFTYSTEFPVLIACTELAVGVKENEDNIVDMAMLQVEETIRQYTQSLGQ